LAEEDERSLKILKNSVRCSAKYTRSFFTR
jgi:hypothetical protein